MPGRDQDILPADGMDAPPKTALGFGGKTIHRQLSIGDELYLVLHCKVVSDGRKKKKEDGETLAFSAGAATTILAELAASDAHLVAANYGIAPAE